MLSDWSLLWAPGIALARGFIGWLENAISDGKVDLPEWRQLAATMLRMGLPIFALIWGLNIKPEVASTLVLVLDYLVVKIYSAIKKQNIPYVPPAPQTSVPPA